MKNVIKVRRKRVPDGAEALIQLVVQGDQLHQAPDLVFLLLIRGL